MEAFDVHDDHARRQDRSRELARLAIMLANWSPKPRKVAARTAADVVEACMGLDGNPLTCEDWIDGGDAVLAELLGVLEAAWSAERVAPGDPSPRGGWR